VFWSTSLELLIGYEILVSQLILWQNVSFLMDSKCAIGLWKVCQPIKMKNSTKLRYKQIYNSQDISVSLEQIRFRWFLWSL